MNEATRALFKRLRKRLQLTQAELGDIADIGQSTVSKLEIETEYDPSLSAFRKYAHGLQMTGSSLLAQIEVLQPQETAKDNQAISPPAVASEKDLSLFAPFWVPTDEQIDAAVVRYFQDHPAATHSEKSPADDQPATEVRAVAAERRPRARTTRPHHVRTPSKKRRRQRP